MIQIVQASRPAVEVDHAMSGSSLDASKVRADKALYAVLVKAHRANLDRYLAAQDTHKPASVKEAPHDPIITFDGPPSRLLEAFDRVRPYVYEHAGTLYCFKRDATQFADAIIWEFELNDVVASLEGALFAKDNWRTKRARRRCTVAFKTAV